MAWSDNARKAALEARRRKGKKKSTIKGRQKITVRGAGGAAKYSTTLPRRDFAAYVKEAREHARSKWGRRSSVKRRNQWARASARSTVIDEGYD